MRRPTPEHVALAHWRRSVGEPVVEPDALAHLAERHDEDPEPGFYRMRMRPGAPWAPARLWLRQDLDEHGDLAADEIVLGEIDGRRAPARLIARRWSFMRPISRSAFLALSAERERADRIGDVFRATHARVDLSKEFITP